MAHSKDLNEISHFIFRRKTRGPRFAPLSEIATADMQILCNIFSNPVIATNERIIIMSSSWFWKSRMCFLIIVFTIYAHDSQWSMWHFEQIVNPVSTVGSTLNLVKIGQVVSERLFTNSCHGEPGYTLPLQTVLFRSQLIWICTVCYYVNLQQQSRSSNLIGRKLELAMAF